MTKEELKAKIAEITKENTTEMLHAEVLNALVDMMPEGGLNVVDVTDVEFDTALDTEMLNKIRTAQVLVDRKIGDKFPLITSVDDSFAYNDEVSSVDLMFGCVYFNEGEIEFADAIILYESSSAGHPYMLKYYNA